MIRREWFQLFVELQADKHTRGQFLQFCTAANTCSHYVPGRLHLSTSPKWKFRKPADLKNKAVFRKNSLFFWVNPKFSFRKSEWCEPDYYKISKSLRFPKRIFRVGIKKQGFFSENLLIQDSKWRIGFAKQSRSFTMEWLCEAKPIHQNWLALRSKANCINLKGFAKQSPSIMMERLCEAKPILHNGMALRSKANPI